MHFSGDFLGAFDFLRIACSPGIPQARILNLTKSRFLQTPLVNPHLYNAPSMHTVEQILGSEKLLEKCR